MPSRPATTALTIGFFGTGTVDVEHGTGLIEEHIDARVTKEDRVRWIFVLTSDEFTQTLAEFAGTAKDFEIAYEVITKPDDKSRRTFNEVANDAARIYSVEDPLLQMEQILREAPQSALFILWDKEREDEMERISTQFLDAEIDVYELSDALTPMVVDDEEPAEATVTNIRQPEPAEETEAEGIYSRTDLKEMSMQRLKEVTVALGNQPRKSREQMVTEILAAQSGEAEVAESEPAVAVEVMPGTTAIAAVGAVDWTAMEEVLDRFGNTFIARMSDTFDTFLTDLGKTLEGVAFNLTPEAPAPVEVAEPEPEQPRRRMLRRNPS